MIFSVERNLLCETVSNLSRVVTAKAAIPVLEGILISAKGGIITLSSYNLETGMKKQIDGTVEKEGDIVISAKVLNNILHSLNGEKVKISCDEKLLCKIESGSAVFEIMGMAAVDFPEIPTVADSKKISLSAGVLKDMVRRTIFAVAPSEGTRPILTGIKVTVKDGMIELVAVDGFRVAIRKEKIKSDEELGFIVSGRALNEAVKIISDDDQELSLFVGGRHICFTADGYTFILRLLEGEFIDYSRAIPPEASQKMKVNNRTITEIVERISLIISDHFTTPLRIMIDEKETVFSCATAVGRATEKANFEVSGKGFEIGLNSRFLLEALRAAEDDEITLNFNGSNAPVVLRNEKNDYFTYVIIPMRLQ